MVLPEPAFRTVILLVWWFALHDLECARGDGGTIRYSERTGNYRVTVFTSPTPFRAGPVDISVFVQEEATGEPAPDVQITVRLARAHSPADEISHHASAEAATNKLYHAAQFDLPGPGRWLVHIDVEGPNGPGVAEFQIDAGAPLPRWSELGWWIALPIVPIVLFLLHQIVVYRSSGRRPDTPAH